MFAPNPLLPVLFALLVLLAAAVAAGSAMWSRATARTLVRLDAARQPSPGARFSPRDLEGLPPPVARYFTFALTAGQPLVARAEIRHAGHFAMRPGAWSPFTSSEVFVVRPPGFLWDATIRIAGVPVRVHDGYVGGAGLLRAAIAGLITVAHLRDTPDLAQGELLRYLAEGVWLPTALLPACGVRWSPIDDGSARATLSHEGTTVSIDVQFGARGEITRIAARRPRIEGNTTVLAPWAGTFGDYAVVDGMQVPMTGEVAWDMPAGPEAYWRGRIVRATYAFEL